MSSIRFANQDFYWFVIGFLFFFRKTGLTLNLNELRKMYGNLGEINSIFSVNELKIV